MKLTTTKKELTRAIAAARKIVDKRSTMPILKCVVIKTVKKKATFHVNDLEISLTIPLETHQHLLSEKNVEGTVIVNLVALGKAVKAMKGDIILCAKEDKLIVSGGGMETSIPTHDINDFPIPPAWPKEIDTNETSATDLHTALQRVSYAMSNNETRCNLCGVYIEHDGRSTAKVVATNGHVLTKTEVTFKGKSFKAIIPSKAVTALSYLLKGIDEKITIAIENIREGGVKGKILRTLMHLRFNGAEISIRLVDGEYPDWVLTIPKYNPNSITFKRAALLETVQNIQALSTKDNFLMVITYPNEDEKKSKFSIANGFAETTSETILDCENSECIDEAPEQMGINVNYLVDTLKNCNGADNVTLKYGSEYDPILINEGNNQHIIMPMKLL